MRSGRAQDRPEERVSSPVVLITRGQCSFSTLVPEREHQDGRSGDSVGSAAHPGGGCEGGGRRANVTARNTSLVGSVSHTECLRLTLSSILF